MNGVAYDRRLRRIRRARRIVRTAERFRKAWGETYMKRITTFIVLNAVGWVWSSYGLAHEGRYEIAQDLSKAAITTILGIFVTYGVKSLTENISKNGYTGRKSRLSDAGEPGENTDGEGRIS